MNQKIYHITKVANGYVVILPPDLTEEQPMLGLNLINDKNTHIFVELADAINFLTYKLKEL